MGALNSCCRSVTFNLWHFSFLAQNKSSKTNAWIKKWSSNKIHDSCICLRNKLGQNKNVASWLDMSAVGEEKSEK